MSNEQSNLTFLSKAKIAAGDGAFYALSALFVTPLTIAAQNLKVRIQDKGISHRKAFTSLYMEGGQARFFYGFWPHTVRNMGVSGFGGLALEAAKDQTKDLGYEKGTTAILNATLAGAAETAAIGYMEGVELTKTKNISVPAIGRLGKTLSLVVHSTYHTTKIAPFLFGRNTFYWGGTVATDYYADKHKLSMEQRASLGTVAGFATGVISTPLDVAATAAFAEKSIKNKFKEIKNTAGFKAALRGTVLRGLQTGAFTAATSIALELNKEFKNDETSRDTELNESCLGRSRSI
jgi:hypothetical protein